MNRGKKLLILPAVIAAFAVTAAAPAFADKGGNPHQGSCGLGMETAHEAIASEEGPRSQRGRDLPALGSGLHGPGLGARPSAHRRCCEIADSVPRCGSMGIERS